MTTIRTNLLRQLAEHLLHGKMGHEIFDITQFNNSRQPKCGTVGDAIGECPIVWPDKWRWSAKGEPVLIETKTPNPWQVFFKIKHLHYEHLFVPFSQNVEKFGGDFLRKDATKKQVANNILIFCDKADNGEF
jgi:hypothetical protein